jgi:putative SOS response-associated peptidase YedK
MCYFSSISVSFKIIEDRFGVRFVQSESFQPVYSISAFTFPALPVISDSDPDQITFMHWGLVPFWVKDSQSALNIREKTLNSRSETIFDKPAFRNSIQSRRCLVLADGFFEWRHVDNKAIPYYIRLKNGLPFAFAGIWDSWTSPEKHEPALTFSVITTRANSLLEKIHNIKKRMPVILPQEKERLWIKKGIGRDTIQSLLQPYNAAEMEAYPVARNLNKLGFNTTIPEILVKQDYPGLPELE